MSKEEIIKRCNQALLETFPHINSQDVSPDKKLIDNLWLDDLDDIELIMQLEDRFGISICEEDAEKVVTVQDMYDIVEKMLARKECKNGTH